MYLYTEIDCHNAGKLETKHYIFVSNAKLINFHTNEMHDNNSFVYLGKPHTGKLHIFSSTSTIESEQRFTYFLSKAKSRESPEAMTSND